MKVAELMSQSVLVLSPDTTLEAACQTLANLGVSGTPVVEGDRLVGVFSKSDIVDDLSDGEIILSDPVERTMARSPVTVGPDDDVSHAIAVFARTRYHRLVVVSAAGEVVGMLTLLDVVTALHDGRLASSAVAARA